LVEKNNKYFLLNLNLICLCKKISGRGSTLSGYEMIFSPKTNKQLLAYFEKREKIHDLKLKTS